jgi:hypothetical protein
VSLATTGTILTSDAESESLPVGLIEAGSEVLEIAATVFSDLRASASARVRALAGGEIEDARSPT